MSVNDLCLLISKLLNSPVSNIYRFHAFSVSDEYDDTLASFQNTINDGDNGTQNGRGRGDGMPSLKLGVGVREDVIALWEELDEARNTMAEIQALQIELSDPKLTPSKIQYITLKPL